MAKNPIDCIKAHAPHLVDAFTKTKGERQDATDLALKEFEALHKELENFKAKVIPKYTKKPYVSPDKSEAIKSIQAEYNKKIADETTTNQPGSILGSGVEDKERWMNTKDEDRKYVIKNAPDLDPNNKDLTNAEKYRAEERLRIAHKENVEEAISDKKYQKAIDEGRITANDAKTIIESAGLEVPKDILEKAKDETTNPQAPDQKTETGDKQSKLPSKVKSKLAAFKDKYVAKEPQVVSKPIKPKRKGDNRAAIAAKKVYKDIGEIDEPSDARGMALAYLVGGGKVSEASINDVAGSVKKAGLNVWWRKEKKTDEVRARDYASKDAPSFDEIAHKIWDNLPENLDGITTQDIKAELMDVVNSHNTRLSAAEEFRDRYIKDESANDLTEQDAKEIDNIQHESLLKITSEIPENQQEAVIEKLKKYQDKYLNIDWERVNKDFDGFDTDLLSLPEEAIIALDGLVKKHIQQGQGESPNLNDKGLPPQESKSQEKANAPPLKQIKESTTEAISDMKDIVKDLVEDGTTSLKDIQKVVADELGDKSQEMKDLVEDAYHEFGKEPIDKGVTTGVIGQVGKFVSRLFGGKPQEKVYIARNTEALMKKAEEVVNPQFQNQPLTPEQKATTDLLNAAKNEYQVAKNSFDAKRKQLDKEVLKDQEDLFGERKATQEAATSLFDERVSQSARNKAIEPFKARMLKAENEVNRLQKKLDGLGSTTAQTSLFMKSPDGKVLGFTHNNKIYLNGEHLNPNTPIHEAGHIWTEWSKQNQPEVYKKGMQLVSGTRYLKKAQESKFYQAEASKLSKAEREAYFKHEALAMAIGDKGAQFVTEARRNSFKDWLSNLWDSIKKAAGFKDITAKELSKLNFDEFTKRAAKDILDETGFEGTKQKPAVEEKPVVEKLDEDSEGSGKEPPEGGVKIVESTEGEDLSGIKKALVSDEIIKGIDLEKVGDKEMMDMGRKILETGEVNPDALVTKIITDGKGVLTPAEVVGLITYKRDIDNQVSDKSAEFNKKRTAGEDTGTLGVEIAKLEKQIEDYNVMSLITAQQQSLAFRLRQYLLDKNYNAVRQIEKFKKVNNGTIPPEVESRLREMEKLLKEKSEEIKKLSEQKKDEEGQEAVDNIKESIDREKKYTEAELQDRLRKERASSRAAKKEKVHKAIDETMSKWAKKLSADLPPGTQKQGFGDIEKVMKAVGATMKKAYDAGVEIAKIVQDAVDFISEKLGHKDWGVEEFQKENWEERLKETTPKKEKDKPTIKEDGTVSIPNKMLRDLVERGITDINDLTDAVHKEVVKDLPDITKRQVRDYITGYGKKVNPTAADIDTQINTAKRVGRLMSELEDLQKLNKVQFALKYQRPKPDANKITDAEREIKRKIKSLMKDEFGDVELKTDEQKINEEKQRVKDRIAELERQKRTGNFSKKKIKKAKPTDEELERLKIEESNLIAEVEEIQYKNELKNRSMAQKIEDHVYEWTLGVTRGLTLGVDLSAPGIQGMRHLFISPVKSAQAFWESLKFLASEKYGDRFLARLRASPYYPQISQTGLIIDNKVNKVNVREAIGISNKVNYLWNKLIAPVLGIGTKRGTEIARKLNPYAAGQRAFDGYVNVLRTKIYIEQAKELERDGYTFESDPEVFKKSAGLANTETASAHLGKADLNSRWLNLIFTAPRKFVSEFKLYTPYALVYYARLPKAVRKRALLNAAKFTVSFVTVNAAIWALRKDWDDEEDDHFWDITSSDFMTHRIGNKRIGIGGGAKSMMNLIGRFWKGEYTDQYGKTTKLGERFGREINSKADLLVSFTSGKFTPLLGALYKKLDESKGREIDNEELLRNLAIPMWMQDLKDVYKDDPATVGAFINIMSIFGAQTRVVDPKKQGNTLTNPKVKADYERTKDDPDKKDWFVGKSITARVEHKEETVPMTEKQKEQFKEDIEKESNRIVDDYFERFGEYYDRMPDKARKEKLEELQGRAREIVVKRYKVNVLKDEIEKIEAQKKEESEQAKMEREQRNQ